MECPNCHQPVETGAAFCGNCGQALNGVAQPQAYALALPAQQKGETQALLAILFGAIGLVGAAFMALLGLCFGLMGLVLGTIGRSGAKKSWSTAGIVISSFALIAGMAVWTYAYNHAKSVKVAQAAASNGPTVTADNLSTPCYTIGFADKLNIANSSGSCDMRAFNGATMDASSDAYKVYASQSSITNAGSFTETAKAALEKDVKINLPGFNLLSEQVGAFAGSPDYVVIANDSMHNITVAEAAVLHQTAGGANAFILVHATNGRSADFRNLEAQWQWK